MDNAARRSGARVRLDARNTAERMATAFASDARRFGHHGRENLIKTIRQRHNSQITDEYAEEPLRRAGYDTNGKELAR